MGKRGPKPAAKLISAEINSGKVDTTEFAEKSATTAGRVLRYLKAWDAAALDGIVPEALAPGSRRLR
jgi:hypothetical protein